MTQERTTKAWNGYLFIFLTLALAVATVWTFVNAIRGQHVPSLIAAGVLLLLTVLTGAGLFIVNPNESKVLILFGKYVGTVKDNGFWWANPFLVKKKVTLRARNLNGEKLKVNDKAGNPIQIAAVVVWQVEDTFRASFDVDDFEQYVVVQSEAAVRHLAGRYPYDTFEDNAEEKLTLFPVDVKAGDRLQQAITLTLKGEFPAASTAATETTPTFSVGNSPQGILPRLGLGAASHKQPLTLTDVTRLSALHLTHLRLDLKLNHPDYPTALQQTTTEARALGAALEVALHLSDNAANELSALAALLQEVKPPVCTWLIFHQAEKSTREQWLRLASEQLAGYNPTAKLGAGSNVFFTELNRCPRLLQSPPHSRGREQAVL